MNDIIEVKFPFIRDTFEEYDVDDGGTHTVHNWRPGVESQPMPPYGEYSDYFADGVGLMTLEVIGRHKPGKYPERVFYVRQWIDPDGNRFGKTNLRITSAANFTRLCKGYAHHFKMREEIDA